MRTKSGNPRRVASFKIMERLGAGGMGVVYLAENSRGDRVALKLIRDELAGDETFRRRFAREATAAQCVDGSFTARVVDFDMHATPPYLATEYVPGPTLEQFVSEHGPLRGEALRAFAVALAQALVAVHAAGVVHRDLKPSNVLLTDGGPKVIDFGIARAADATALTGTGMTLGTAAWMAPEQARGTATDGKADVFSWASVVVYAATGRSPFGDGPSDAVLYRIVHEHASLDGVDAALVPLLELALDKSPTRRPDARSLVGLLLDGHAHAARGGSDDATATLYVERTWELPNQGGGLPARAQRRRGRVAVVGVATALLVASLGAYATYDRDDTRATAPRATSLARIAAADAAPSPTSSEVEEAPPAVPDATEVPLRRLLARGTELMDVVYPELDGSAPREIVLASSNDPTDPFSSRFVDVFTWRGGRWRKVLDATEFRSPGARRVLLDPELSGVELAFLEGVDFFGDGSSELVVGVQHYGASSGPLDVSVLEFAGGEVRERFFTQTTSGGELDRNGNTIVLTSGSYTPADPHCCPSFTATETIAARGSEIGVVAQKEVPVDTGDVLSGKSRLRIDGIGAMTVGMTLDEASEAAGVALDMTYSRRGCGYAEPIGGPRGLSMMIERGRVTRFDVGGGAIRTLSGIGIGAPASLLSETYPGRIERSRTIYGDTVLDYVPEDDTGYLMRFGVYRGAITYMSSGRAESVRYAEGCF